MPGHTHLKDSINLKDFWCLPPEKKSTSSFMFSWRYCKDIETLLLWVLCKCLASDTINLGKIFVFICWQKINFIPTVFLEILQGYANFFDYPTALWPITRETEFCQIWDWWWNINNNISFHFRLFLGKTKDRIVQKIQKPYFGVILGTFSPNLCRNKFFWETDSVSC